MEETETRNGATSAAVRAPLVGLFRTGMKAGAQALVLLIFSALPTASSCFVLASRMGYNGPYVAGLVTLSTVLGMASLPPKCGRRWHSGTVPARRHCDRDDRTPTGSASFLEIAHQGSPLCIASSASASSQ